jgi:hypothetical protein
MRSALGKMIDADLGRRPSFLDFFRSDSSNVEGTHLVAVLLLPFLVIFSRCATFLMGIHKRRTRGAERRVQAQGGQAMAVAEE